MPAPRLLRALAPLALCGVLSACGRDRPTEEVSPPPPGPPQLPATGGRVHEVRVRAGAGGEANPFDPALVTARRGDVVRFVLADSGAARGVSFPTEGNPAGAALPAPSPLMHQTGQVYEIPVDLPAGDYAFTVLPPHPGAAPGRLTVVP